MENFEFLISLLYFFVFAFLLIESSWRFWKFSTAWRNEPSNRDKTFGPNFFDFFYPGDLSEECMRYRNEYVKSIKNAFLALSIGFGFMIFITAVNRVFHL